MKKVTGIQESIKDFDGKAVLGPEGPVKAKTMMLSILGSSKAADGEEAIQCVAVGIKIASTKSNEILFEDSEIKLLVKKISENSIGLSALAQGTVFGMLKNAVSVDPNTGSNGQAETATSIPTPAPARHSKARV